MKVLLLFYTLVSACVVFGQSENYVDLDSIQTRLNQFNDSITKILEKYEADSVDFIVIRSNISYGPHCRFRIREDSCTRMFTLYLGEKDLMKYIHSATIASREPNDKRHRCTKELDQMYYSLTSYEDYFTKSKPDYSSYDASKIIFIGSVDGRYMYEAVEKNYFSTHHSGMFFATFSIYF